jgi:hypothetical protein
MVLLARGPARSDARAGCQAQPDAPFASQHVPAPGRRGAPYLGLLARGTARFHLLGCLVALACACSEGDRKRGNEYLGDGSFGSAPPEIYPEGGPPDGESGDLDAGGANGNVSLRVFHGVLNLPGVRFCFDPDFQPDDPHTPENEADAGPDPAVEIVNDQLDGGVLPLGIPAGYFTLEMARREGAITVHRAPLPADGGADSGGTNAPTDGGRGGDASAGDAAVGPCDPATLEAVLPIPLTPGWFEPPRPVGDAGAAGQGGSGDAGASDAGFVSLERRGLVPTLSGDMPLTLFGSGRSLDPQRLMERRNAARDAHLMRDPGDDAGAETAGRAAVAWLESALGPRFLLTRGVVPATKNTSFGLTLVHLIPDVFPSIDGGVPADTGSGTLHVCVRIDTFESDLADGGITRVDFRNSLTFDPLAPTARYVFRLFVEADFVRTQATCGVTSLKPVAELTVELGRFKPGQSYTLVAWGARSPSDLCTAYPNDAVVRPGCAHPADELNAVIELLTNDLPPE